MSLVSSLAMLCLISMTAFAAKQDDSIDENVAAAIALLFVYGSIDSSSTWDITTKVDDVISLYDSNDDDNAYCVKLDTSSTPSGYVTVATNLNEVLIQEYSDVADPLFKSLAIPANRSAANNKKTYYGGPLLYSTDSTITSENKPVPASNTINSEDSQYEANRDLVVALRYGDIYCLTNESRAKGYISDPLVFLAKQFLGYAFPYIDSHDLGESAIPAYYINERDACSLYGIAAVLDYPLSDGVSFNSWIAYILQMAADCGYSPKGNNSD